MQAVDKVTKGEEVPERGIIAITIMTIANNIGRKCTECNTSESQTVLFEIILPPKFRIKPLLSKLSKYCD